ncbi:MAG: phosphate signaling complex protein PhoU [Ardenticatenales bacterium]|nr:phosphate signaling complex protein PhoU [Ardenticatenales bacterium]
MSSIRGNFDQQLTNLGHRLLRMGSLVDEAIDHATRSLVERDSDLALDVIRKDSEINTLRYSIEEQSYTLLATQQPLAGDLRRVAAAISIATNMERQADHAAGIAVLARRLNKEPELKSLMDIPRMADTTRSMLRHSLDAYLSADAELARAVATEDAEINELNEKVLQELLRCMIDDPRTIRRATYLLWVSHNLERIGDRTKNICERVVYVATGELADFDVHADTEEALDEHDVLGKLPL